MKYLTEYRNPQTARNLVSEIRKQATQRWRIMEVCGGQTHNLLKYGIESELTGVVELIHGPGCPVCVTPAEIIDIAQQISLQPSTILTTFGDMLRVPGTAQSLNQTRASGGDVRIVYSPVDAVELARLNPDLDVVFLGVGFETTAPSTALAVLQAEQLRLDNFSVLVSHVRVLPAMRIILESSKSRLQGFLAAGHVCTITGLEEYQDLVDTYEVPVVITGFEPIDLLQGIQSCVHMLEQGKPRLLNCYPRSVKHGGNVNAMKLIDEVYQIVDQSWRGIGIIPAGGLSLKPNYRKYDAWSRFVGSRSPVNQNETVCQSAEVLQGLIKPPECSAYGKSCKPAHPLGAPMVSSEGACAAYYRYRINNEPQSEKAPLIDG
ncbi:hydrogenase formation protein HypD [Rubinisphaera italica]|uniref:Hydrogenase expression/formation protein HypD n=1 Tax=Rubinisphaera italica TaxID=2527969 RepID=A0A5C5XAE6_9PLAN|nr:hydrogenase formation protein HypD [Rubinisphaera italica]TWT59679.1 Hydrogenase expression/formation protein HypD [Rubinisphaera italica]